MSEPNSSQRGCFITVEGAEGAGKTTSLAMIRQYLANAGRSVRVTREPGGTSLGEEMRKLLLEHRAEGMAADAELLLVFAARVEHVAQVIGPALARGEWVLCDRFTDATYAYQGEGRGIPSARIASLEQWAVPDLRPDLTLLLDVPIRLGLRRASQRGAQDRFEQEGMEFFERVRRGYRARAEAEPQRFRIIDASPSLDRVQAEIRQTLHEFLQNWCADEV